MGIEQANPFVRSGRPAQSIQPIQPIQHRISRADLLRCLSQGAELPDGWCASSLGYDYQAKIKSRSTIKISSVLPIKEVDKPRQLEARPQIPDRPKSAKPQTSEQSQNSLQATSETPPNSPEQPNEIDDPSFTLTPLIRTAPINHRYWYLHRQELLSEDQKGPAIPQPLSQVSVEPAEPGVPLATEYDRRVGDWQIIWDQSIPSETRPGQIDLRATVQQIAQGRSGADWVRKPRRVVRRLILIIDRSPTLRPMWADLHQAWHSLRRHLGDEVLTTYYVPAGPTGSVMQPGTGRRFLMPEMPAGAGVVLIGAFGALHTGQINAEWSDFICRLRERRHPIQLMPVCPIPQIKQVSQAPLVPAVATQQYALLAALSQAWLPELKQLRMLRRAVPGATLLDELRVYNHPAVQTSGDLLWLSPDDLAKQMQHYLELPRATKGRIQQAVTAWQASLGSTICELDQLQRSLDNQPDPVDYPRLHNLAAQVAMEHKHHRPGMPPSGAYQLFQSLLPLALSLADSPARVDWYAFLGVTQQVADQTGQPLPLKQQGLGNQPHWLTQDHQGLRLHIERPHSLISSSTPLPSLLKTQGVPYDEQRRSVLSRESDPVRQDLILRDQQYQYELRAIIKPDWAERLWCDAQGLHAAHCQGATFNLQSASINQTKACWGVNQQPWLWAEEIGVDEYGLWVEIKNLTIHYLLRWVPVTKDEAMQLNGSLSKESNFHPGFWLEQGRYTKAAKNISQGSPSALLKRSSSDIYCTVAQNIQVLHAEKKVNWLNNNVKEPFVKLGERSLVIYNSRIVNSSEDD